MIRPFLLFLVWVVAPFMAFCQMEDPTHWTYEVKKTAVHEYDLIFHLNIDKGWHIWSLHPGGDGYEIAPSFTFPNNPGLTLVGDIRENGKVTTTKMEGIDGDITYLSGKVDYIQHVMVSAPLQVIGKHTYQVCNDKLCLPPTDRNFTFTIK
ncbi:MAG: hypothetical protein EBZ77_13250 [Chitinophagia bacterium]|nr:hypothetical protein [Chitinophagia bacterium]